MLAKPWEIAFSVYDESAHLTGLQRRERRACTCLLKRYAPRLYRLALQLTGNPDEAEDVLQESFIRACAHVDDFAGRSELGTWLHRIVLNSAHGRLRPRAREHTVRADLPTGEAQALVEPLPDPAPSPGTIAHTAELQEIAERALLALPEALRVAFVLRDVEGLSTGEAAAALGITESALKVRLHRAHRALRPALGPYMQRAAQPRDEVRGD